MAKTGDSIEDPGAQSPCDDQTLCDDKGGTSCDGTPPFDRIFCRGDCGSCFCHDGRWTCTLSLPPTRPVVSCDRAGSREMIRERSSSFEDWRLWSPRSRAAGAAHRDRPTV